MHSCCTDLQSNYSCPCHTVMPWCFSMRPSAVTVTLQQHTVIPKPVMPLKTPWIGTLPVPHITSEVSIAFLSLQNFTFTRHPIPTLKPYTHCTQQKLNNSAIHSDVYVNNPVFTSVPDFPEAITYMQCKWHLVACDLISMGNGQNFQQLVGLPTTELVHTETTCVGGIYDYFCAEKQVVTTSTFLSSLQYKSCSYENL